MITTSLYVTPVTTTRTGSRQVVHPLGYPVNTANQNHPACHHPDRNRTLILWKETDLIHGKLMRNVVITLDATIRTAVILSLPEVIELANKLRMAAGNHDTATDTPIGTGELDSSG